MVNLSKTFLSIFNAISPTLSVIYDVAIKAGLIYGYYKYIYPRSTSTQASIYLTGVPITFVPVLFMNTFLSYPLHYNRSFFLKSVLYSLFWPYSINILLTDPIRLIDPECDTVQYSD